MKSIPKYFTKEEIECPCGCGKIIIQPIFYEKMCLLRALMDTGIRINSWTRCEKHNREVGGSPTSSHLQGWAADVHIGTSEYGFKLIFLAGLVGFRGIGIGSHFVHLDDHPQKVHPAVWFY